MLKKQRINRVYSEDFKREAVLMYEVSGKSLLEVCQLLDISAVSVLNRWRVLYGKQQSKRGSMRLSNKPSFKNDKSDILKPELHHQKPEDDAKMLALEAENRHLRQVLGTHAVKEYLAELREESWREVTNSATAQEVERRVAKKR